MSRFAISSFSAIRFFVPPDIDHEVCTDTTVCEIIHCCEHNDSQSVVHRLFTTRKTQQVKAIVNSVRESTATSLALGIASCGPCLHTRSALGCSRSPASSLPCQTSDNRSHCFSLDHRAAVLRQATATHYTMSDTDTLSQHIGHVDALNLTVSLCLCYTLCIALVRLWIRLGSFGTDDLVVLSATSVTLGHTGTSYAALASGLGKSWSEISDTGKLTELNTVSHDCDTTI